MHENVIPVENLSANTESGKKVTLSGVVTNDSENRVFLVQNFDSKDDYTSGVRLSHENLFSLIRRSGVPLRIPHGLLFKAKVKGRISIDGDGNFVLNEITFLKVQGIVCINTAM